MESHDFWFRCPSPTRSPGPLRGARSAGLSRRPLSAVLTDAGAGAEPAPAAAATTGAPAGSNRCPPPSPRDPPPRPGRPRWPEARSWSRRHSARRHAAARRMVREPRWGEVRRGEARRAAPRRRLPLRPPAPVSEHAWEGAAHAQRRAGGRAVEAGRCPQLPPQRGVRRGASAGGGERRWLGLGGGGGVGSSAGVVEGSRGTEGAGDVRRRERSPGPAARTGRRRWRGGGGVVLPQLPAGAEKRWGLQSPQSCRADGAPLGRFDVPGRTLAVCGSALAAGAVLPFDMLWNTLCCKVSSWQKNLRDGNHGWYRNEVTFAWDVVNSRQWFRPDWCNTYSRDT